MGQKQKKYYNGCTNRRLQGTGYADIAAGHSIKLASKEEALIGTLGGGILLQGEDIHGTLVCFCVSNSVSGRG